MKNIRKRIGFESNIHSTAYNERNFPPPIHFSLVHGENITLNKRRSIARRGNSFCKSMTFSDRPIRVGEMVYIKFIELSDAWNGSIRFGFTSHNPDTLKEQLPKYMCPDLTNEKGYWGKAVNEREYAYLNNTMFFYVSKSGNVYCGVEGKSRELLFDNVDVSRHLWMMIDVYGNTVGIEIVNQNLNNSVTVYQEPGFENIDNVRTTGSVDSIHLEMALTRVSICDDHSCNVRPPLCPYVDSRVSNINAGTTTTSSENLRNVNQLRETRKNARNLILTPLPFHNTHAVNIRLTNDRITAARFEGEYCKGYVFSSKLIVPNEFVVIRVLKTEGRNTGGMAFGMTTKNPSTIDPLYLPEDSDNLLDSADSFYVHKNVANSPREGDILIFSFNSDGEVRMKKNEDHQLTVFHVEKNLPYWWFLDLYGSTVKVQAYTGVAENLTNELPVQNSLSLPFLNTATQVLILNSLKRNGNNFKPLNIVIENQGGSRQILTGLSSTQSGDVQSTENYETENGAFATKLKTQQVANDYLGDNGKNREQLLQKRPETSRLSSSSSLSAQIDCIVCCEEPVDCVLYRCGHMCMCYPCACELWRGRGDGHCPYCRAVIRDVVRTYKS